MYQLHVTIQEYPSVWRVFYAFSVTDHRGVTRQLGTSERWVTLDEPMGDALMDSLIVVVRASQAEIRRNR